ncbi:MAG: NfeD family protein [Planctomycetota bacterium]|jgi:membrane-bound serine protease (ClpP class)
MDIVLLVAALVLAALILTMLEILTPSFGILGGLAVVAAASAVVVAWSASSLAGLALLIALAVATPLYLVFLVRWLPRTPMGKRLFLKNRTAEAGEGTPEAELLEHMIGKIGTAETMLRPSGAVRVDGRRVVGLSETGIINKGRAVKVIGSAGVNLIVRAATEDEAAES